jgi:hypothetical protein
MMMTFLKHIYGFYSRLKSINARLRILPLLGATLMLVVLFQVVVAETPQPPVSPPKTGGWLDRAADQGLFRCPIWRQGAGRTSPPRAELACIHLAPHVFHYWCIHPVQGIQAHAKNSSRTTIHTSAH